MLPDPSQHQLNGSSSNPGFKTKASMTVLFSISETLTFEKAFQSLDCTEKRTTGTDREYRE
jgi:hypothetical protein